MAGGRFLFVRFSKCLISNQRRYAMADTRPTAEDDERAQREREQRELAGREQEKRQREQSQRERDRLQSDALRSGQTSQEAGTQPPLTKAQQEAIANAPVVKVPEPPQPAEEVSEEQLAAQQADALANAPVVAVPEPPASTESEDDDIASATVVTKQPDGKTDVTTVPSDDEGKSENPPSAVPRRR
jgi:hypothetical protein